MFDLVVHGHRNTTRRDGVTLAISWLVHAIVIGAVVALPVMYATDQLPDTRDDVIAFVVAAPPPPPPPPPAAAPPVAPSRTVARPVPTRAPSALPREVPVVVERAESPTPPSSLDLAFEGVPGGVAGGVPGGIVGGVVGGLPHVGPPPPPPPPPPPQPRAPVRAGGQIQPPSLIERVPPVYPPLAVSAGIQGVVILEATVGQDGRVEEVSVLRSVGLLDRAAMEAVRQWRYEPLLLNGLPVRFILTVTVSFNLST
jgi:protein TonB